MSDAFASGIHCLVGMERVPYICLQLSPLLLFAERVVFSPSKTGNMGVFCRGPQNGWFCSWFPSNQEGYQSIERGIPSQEEYLVETQAVKRGGFPFASPVQDFQGNPVAQLTGFQLVPYLKYSPYSEHSLFLAGMMSTPD